MSNIEKFMRGELAKRKQDGNFRELTVGDSLIDFCSNDYLGFSRNQELIHEGKMEALAGATGSRLISGNSFLAEETEELLSTYHRVEAALIFTSGYMANVGLLSSILTKEDAFIYDEYCHASLIDGMRLSLAGRYKFSHNNLEDLEKKLQLGKGNKMVVVESVYSMDGDLSPLKEILEISKKYNALVIVDEAHAIGVFGEKGRGLADEKDVFARIITFGKAMGLHGAAVLGSTVLKEFLINKARTFIYTTALPPATYSQIQKAYKLLPDANRMGLFELIDYFQDGTKDFKGISFLQSKTPIQGIIVGDNIKAKALAKHLRDAGFFVKAILSPTVKKGTERIRICLHAYNTREEINQLFQVIKDFEK